MMRECWKDPRDQRKNLRKRKKYISKAKVKQADKEEMGYDDFITDLTELISLEIQRVLEAAQNLSQHLSGTLAIGAVD